MARIHIAERMLQGHPCRASAHSRAHPANASITRISRDDRRSPRRTPPSCARSSDAARPISGAFSAQRASPRTAPSTWPNGRGTGLRNRWRNGGAPARQAGACRYAIGGFPDAALDDLTIQVQRERHRLDATAAKVQARWDQRGVWRSDGSRSAAARLARDTSTSLPRARRDLRRAHHLTTMPVLAEASGMAGCRWTTSTSSPMPTPPPVTTPSSATKRCSSNSAPSCASPKPCTRSATGSCASTPPANMTPTSRRPPTPPPSTPPPCWTASSASTGTSTRSAAPPSSPSSTASCASCTWLMRPPV